MKVTGFKENSMATENTSTHQEVYTKVNGKMTIDKDREKLGSQMAKLMKENGLRVNGMDKANIPMYQVKLT